MANSNLYVKKKLFSYPYYVNDETYYKLSDILATFSSTTGNDNTYNLSNMASATGKYSNSYFSPGFPAAFADGTGTWWRPALKGTIPTQTLTLCNVGAGTYTISRGTDSSGDYITISNVGTFRASSFYDGVVPSVLLAIVQAGGGGGAGGSGSVSGSGGGAGSVGVFLIVFDSSSRTFSVTVGSGGSAGSGGQGSSGKQGGTGGTSSITTGSTTNSFYGGTGGNIGDSGGAGGEVSSTSTSYPLIYLLNSRGANGGNDSTTGYHFPSMTYYTYKYSSTYYTSYTTDYHSGGSGGTQGGGGGASMLANGGAGANNSGTGSGGGTGAGGGGGAYVWFDGKSGGSGGAGRLIIKY